MFILASFQMTFFLNFFMFIRVREKSIMQTTLIDFPDCRLVDSEPLYQIKSTLAT